MTNPQKSISSNTLIQAKKCAAMKIIFCTGVTRTAKTKFYCTGMTSPANQPRKDPFHMYSKSPRKIANLFLQCISHEFHWNAVFLNLQGVPWRGMSLYVFTFRPKDRAHYALRTSPYPPPPPHHHHQVKINLYWVL